MLVDASWLIGNTWEWILQCGYGNLDAISFLGFHIQQDCTLLVKEVMMKAIKAKQSVWGNK